MNKELLRKKLLEKKGRFYNFTFNGSRNQCENFFGQRIDIFPSVFLIRTYDDNPRIRSFSYNDIITSSLEIHDK